MVRVLPSCKDVSALVSQSLDRELPLAKRVSIRIHPYPFGDVFNVSAL
jgi:hypothetical protein